MHPALKFDLLGAMIEALHKKGIRRPVYTTVVWDEYAAGTHPEWIQIDEDGRQVGRGPLNGGGTGWKWLCVNNGYMDYLASQVDEILEYNPELGWFWKTSCGFSPKGCETRFFIGSFPKN
jgi:hypothetical protein